jgi:polyhydroxybutyrate depolymerase
MMNRMKTKPILTGLFLLAGIVPAAPLQTREWTVDGVARQALIRTPEAVPENGSPLVFVFHGHGGTMQHAARSFRIHELWPEAVVVYMQGLPTRGQLTDPEGKRSGWNANPDDPDNRDLKFFDAVYAALSDRIDSSRVYATGHSNGGSFTYCLWAARGDVLAATAPSAALSVAALPKLKPKPALHIAGETDPLVKYAWQEKMMLAVRKLNGCAKTGEPWASAGDLEGTLYPSAGGTPVVTLIHPGGHTFSSGAPELIVRFFKEHSRF